MSIRCNKLDSDSDSLAEITGGRWVVVDLWLLFWRAEMKTEGRCRWTMGTELPNTLHLAAMLTTEA